MGRWLLRLKIKILAVLRLTMKIIPWAVTKIFFEVKILYDYG